MDFLAARHQTNPTGPRFVTGGVAKSDHIIEAFRHRHDGHTLVLAGESLVHSDIDVSWLAAAADTYDISGDPRDYVLTDVPIVTVDFPNRNMQAFPYEEVAYFDPLYGKFVYSTFNAKPCISGSALVSTDRGLIRMDEVGGSGAQYVLTRKGRARIKAWQCTGYKAVATITTQTGGQLQATGNHPVLVLLPSMILKWTNVEDLKTGDVVVTRLGALVSDEVRLDDARLAAEALYSETFTGKVPSGDCTVLRYPPYRRTKKFPDVVTPELARVLGYLVSEGSIGDQIGFTNTNDDLLDDYRRCWEQCFGTTPQTKEGRTPTGSKAFLIYAARADLRVWLNAIGLAPGRAETKRVPWSILQSPPEIIAQFLCAYVEGDGCLGGNAVQMHSVSHALMLDLKRLIESLGFDARVRLQRPAKGNRQDLWCLTVAQARKFIETIGTVSRRRSDIVLESSHRQDRYRRIPYAKEFVRDVMSRHSFGTGYGRRYYDVCGNEVVGPIVTTAQSDDSPPWASQGNQLTAEHVRGVANVIAKLNPEYADRLRDVAQSDLRYETVTSISWGTIHEPVYDVETTASQFVADGLVVHNCHIDHENKDPLKAKGVIFDASLQFIPAYDVWKIRILAGWDRTKDPWLVDQIVRKKRTGYSMGALVENFVCSACGAIDTNVSKCRCMQKGKGAVTADGKLVYTCCVGVNYIENSSVEDPADITADTEAIWG